jgi:PAS domain-containing protein
MNDHLDHEGMAEALRESEARYRAPFDGSPDAILLADPDEGLVLLFSVYA